MTRAAPEQLYPLSPAQQGLLAQEIAAPQTGHYIVQFVATLEGGLQANAFEQAWQAALERHDALRSAFVWESAAQPLQVVHRKLPLPLTICEAVGPDWLPGFLQQQRQQPFNLRSAPLFSLTLARRADGRQHFVWCYHHLLLDGWSSAIVLGEVFAELAARAAGRSLDPATPTPYAPYLQWLRRQDEAACARFWQEHLAGLQTRPGRSRSAAPAADPASARLLLAAELQQQLDACLRAQHLTPATLVHGLWAMLLARRQGLRDIVIGSVVSGRPEDLPGAHAIVGALINVLPLRVRLPGAVPAAEWLRGLQLDLAQARRFGAVPLGRIAGWAGSPGAALFDSILTVENYPDAPWSAGAAGSPLRVTEVDFVESTAYALTLEAIPAERLMLRVLFDRARLHPSAIATLLDEARRWIEGFTAAPMQPLDTLLQGPPALPRAPAAPAAASLSGATLQARWQAAAQAFADAPAVEYKGRIWSYRQLDERAQRIAATLLRAGVRAEEPVLLLLDRSFDLVAAVLGVLRAGACWVPVEPATPHERLQWLLGDTGARFVLGTCALLAAVPVLAPHAVALDELPAEGTPGEPAPQAPAADRDQAAYILYTSGSTGRPKGVVVTQHNVLRLFDTTAAGFGFGSRDVWTLFHSYAFDFSVWELFGALLHGGRLVLVPRAATRSPEQLLALLQHSGVTVLNLTPSALRMLVAAGPVLGLPSLGAPPLRLVIFGGEALPFDALAPLAARWGEQLQLVNMYGITETTVHVTWRVLDGLDPELTPHSRIGSALPDLQLHLLGAAGERVAEGEEGELLVGGPGLARGYWRDPRLTAERFRPDPFASEPGRRLFHSGDLGRRLPDGDIEYRGRRDRQIKVRGYRVEPGEIEAALRSHPAVQDAVVVRHQEGAESMLVCVLPSLREAAPVRRLLAAARQEPPASLHELPGPFAVLHLHAAETEMMADEILRSSSYLRHGIELRAGDCLFDVGANIGLFSLHCHMAVPGLQVYAFEPIPQLHSLLERNLQAHGVAGAALALALGAAERTAMFSFFPHASVLSGEGVDPQCQQAMVRAYLLHARGAADADAAVLDELLADRLQVQAVSCRVQRLSDQMRRLQVARVDLLKIDVEGAEEAVLAGIDAEHWPCIGQLVLEVHSAAALQRIETMLAGHGFNCTAVRQEAMGESALWMLHASARRPCAAAATTRAAPACAPWRSPAQLEAELRSHLAGRLPEHLRPHSLQLVHTIPLTPNGKVDVAALLGPRPPTASAAPVPGSAAEIALAQAWREVLRVDTVSSASSFFELGGDSIMAVQMVSRVRRLGWEISPAQVFERPVLAALAALAKPLNNRPPPGAAPTSGELPLTPIQHWFFTLQVPARAHWNQALLLEWPAELAPKTLRPALQALAITHDALRLRFEQQRGQWRQKLLAVPGAIPLQLWAAAQRDEATAAAHRGLDLAAGPLLRAAWIDAGPDAAPQLLLVAHHLMVDAVSWRTLVEDLAQGARDALAGRAIRLPAPGAGLGEWARRLQQQVAGFSPGPGFEACLQALEKATPRLPRDHADGSAIESTSASVDLLLSAAETAALVQHVAQASRSRLADVVLAGVALAIARWAGQGDVRIDLESHGRPLDGELDLARTVGWFTEIRPLLIGVHAAPDLRSLLQAVKQAVAAWPTDGVSFGALRWLGSSAAAQRCASLPAAEVCFNFLGEISQATGAGKAPRLLDESAGALHDPTALRPHLLVVDAALVQGRLRLRWNYSSALHERRTVERLAASAAGVLRSMLAEARYTHAPLLAPADFPLADLDAAELDGLLASRPPVEDICRLSPAQEGLLFHALYAPESTVYFTQFGWTLHGELDSAALEQSWRLVLARHAALRTAFVHRGLRQPHQVVQREAELPFEWLDWRALAPQRAEARWLAHAAAERARPFQLQHAPLMRISVARTGEHEYRLLWSHHHIVFDGWCTGLILAEVFGAYEALLGGAEPAPAEPARPYGDYIAWLAHQPLVQAEVFWRAQRPADGAAPVLFGALRDPAAPEHAVVGREFVPADDARLRAFASANALTLNTLVVGAWALLLARRSGSRHVLFGSTAAGRPPGLEGADRIVGLFINTLPLALEVAPEQNLLDWLQALQSRQAAARAFEHVSLAQVQRWWGLARSEALLESAVVFENLPAASLQRRSLPGLQLGEVSSFVRNHFVFTVRAVPEPLLRLEAMHDPRRVNDAPALLAELQALLLGLAGAQRARVVDALAWAAPARLASELERA